MPSTKKRTLARDAQWCVDNKRTLSLKQFAIKFDLLEKQKALNRYRSIINRYLKDDDDRLKAELESWKQTSDYVIFWLARNRTNQQLNSRTSIANYTQNILQQETDAITNDNFHQPRQGVEIAGPSTRPEICTTPTPPNNNCSPDHTSLRENGSPSDEPSGFTDMI
ncbi:unnamed protein product [Absidia cylindrospora]